MEKFIMGGGGLALSSVILFVFVELLLQAEIKINNKKTTADCFINLKSEF
jgi:hypothetical protein